MSDDLVRHLRNSKGWPTLGNAAADRIEELEAKLAKSMQHVADYSNDPHLVGWARRNLTELTGGSDDDVN